MENLTRDQEWVWVIIERHTTDEQLLGQFDQERRESFIPVFRNKDDGFMCLGRMTKKPDHDYQLQAMRFGDVAKAARENLFMIFILGGGGEILDRISFSQ